MEYQRYLCFILTKWYVNFGYKFEYDKEGKSFILTKWYVNYVWGASPNSTSSCFILTKWYVNGLLKILNESERIRFYIN